MESGNKTILALVAASAFTWSIASAHGTKAHDEELAEFDPTSEVFGEYVPGMEPTHTIEVSMADTMRFSPESININQGDIVYMAHVNPGKDMDIIWKFTEAGTFEFGCLLPGHYDAGMKGTITVSPT